MWKPLVGWTYNAPIGSPGGQWIHVETTPAAFGDGRPVEDKLPGTGQGDEFMTPEDQKYLDGKFQAVGPNVWATPPNAGAGQPSGDFLGGINLGVHELQGQVAGLSAEVAAMKAVNEQILAAIQGAEFPVSGTVHIGT
jgi:hypothetical protein